MIEARCTLTQPLGPSRQFVVTTGSNHHFLIDDPQGATGAKPIELVAAALAGCTAFDVINILRKKRQQITAYEVRVEADQVSTPPQVFTEIRVHHIVTGLAVERHALAEAIRLSEEKYCSVGAMLGKAARIHADFEIREESSELGARRPEAVSAS